MKEVRFSRFGRDGIPKKKFSAANFREPFKKFVPIRETCTEPAVSWRRGATRGTNGVEVFVAEVLGLAVKTVEPKFLNPKESMKGLVGPGP